MHVKVLLLGEGSVFLKPHPLHDLVRACVIKSCTWHLEVLSRLNVEYFRLIFVLISVYCTVVLLDQILDIGDLGERRGFTGVGSYEERNKSLGRQAYRHCESLIPLNTLLIAQKLLNRKKSESLR